MTTPDLPKRLYLGPTYDEIHDGRPGTYIRALTGTTPNPAVDPAVGLVFLPADGSLALATALVNPYNRPRNRQPTVTIEFGCCGGSATLPVPVEQGATQEELVAAIVATVARVETGHTERAHGGTLPP